jgi:hypothetical protein
VKVETKHRLPPPRFIILSLDTARRSGWAIFDCGEFRVAGPATTPEHREEVVGIAVTLSRSKGIPLVVGAEDWDMQGMGRAAIFGLGAGFGRWEHVLEREGYDKRLLFRVKVNEWRRMVLGARIGRNERDELKAMAMGACKARGWVVQSDDAAEAALIGFYISRHPPVLDAVREALSRTRGRFVYAGETKRGSGKPGGPR